MKVVETGKRVLGREHPDILISLENLDQFGNPCLYVEVARSSR